VLAKPFEPHMVIGLVNQLLRGERPEQDRLDPTRAREAGAGHVPPASPSLDDYLERLDEALTTGNAPQPMGAGDAGTFSVATFPREPTEDVMPSMDEPQKSAPSPSLADAFSVLLAEELGEMPVPATWGALAGKLSVGGGRAGASDPSRAGSFPSSAPPVITDALVDELTRRVVERLTDSAVRDIVERRVLEVAERLVREEIERIKST
jgi:hypothetical protein